MDMLILDSSTIVGILNGTSMGDKVLNEIKGELSGTSVFSVHEIFLGAKQHELENTNNFFENIVVLSFERDAARESASIEKYLISKGKRINLTDMFIASICKTHNATLITLDKDFLKVPGLKVKLIEN